MGQRRVFVVGVGMTKFVKPGARDWDYPDMAKEAGIKALADAGLKYSDIDQVVVGYIYGDSTSGQRAVYELGLTGVPIYNVNNNCSTGATALFIAKQLVEGGLAECALALGFEKMQRGSLQLQWTDRTTPLGKHIEVMHRQRPPSKAPFAPQMFGNAAREHMERYGTTKEQLAKIAYKNHKHSVNNPYAQFCEEYSLEQILNSPMVYEPLTKLQCCPTSEGAAAAILASEAFVKQHNLEHQAVEIIGMAMATDTEATFKGSMIDMVGFEMSALAAQKAYRQAGVSIKDIQLIELHDCFSSNELITYEALGLCGRGEGGKLVDRGEVTYGGKWVVNPSGGLISKGHPLGATGLAQCAELCWQLRGMAGKRQVANAKVALQHNIGLGGAAVVAIYRLGFPDKFRPYPPNKPNPAVDPNAFRIPSPSPSKRTTEAVGDLKCAKVFADLKQKIAANPGFVQRIGAVYQFDVKTLGGTTVSWTVDLKNGVGDVKEGVSGSAECILTATDEDLAQIMTGKLDAVTAFASGRLKISGNMKQVMKLGELLKAPSKI